MTTYRSLQDYTYDEIVERIAATEKVAAKERERGHHGDAIAALNHARTLRTELHQRALKLASFRGAEHDPIERLVSNLSVAQCHRVAVQALTAAHACLQRGRQSATSVRRLATDVIDLYHDTQNLVAPNQRATP